jgi:hypothetical protein
VPELNHDVVSLGEDSYNQAGENLGGPVSHNA